MSHEAPKRADIRRLFAGEGEQALGGAVARGFGAADDQDGVFAGDRPQDIGVAFGIDGFGDRLGAGHDRFDDDELADGIESPEELWEDRGECGAPLFIAGGFRYGVSDAGLRGDAGNAQVVHVARQSRLRDIKAALGEELSQFFLAANEPSGDNFADNLLSFALIHIVRGESEGQKRA